MTHSICEDPVDIEAREIDNTTYYGFDWIGSKNFLIYDSNITNIGICGDSPTWSYGISNKFGWVVKFRVSYIPFSIKILRYVCAKQIQDGKTCSDFEVRFCCSTNRNVTLNNEFCSSLRIVTEAKQVCKISRILFSGILKNLSYLKDTEASDNRVSIDFFKLASSTAASLRSVL